MEDQGKMNCSACSGAIVPGKAGILKNKIAATHWGFYNELQPLCRNKVKKRVVQDGNIITAGGISCSPALGLKVIEIMFGIRIAVKLAHRLELRFIDESITRVDISRAFLTINKSLIK